MLFWELRKKDIDHFFNETTEVAAASDLQRASALSSGPPKNKVPTQWTIPKGQTKKSNKFSLEAVLFFF